MSLPPRDPWAKEDESWWDVLGAVFEPLGEVALYAAICLIGGGLIVASRRTPIIPLAIAAFAVIASVYVASRFAARAGHRWTSATYLAVTALIIGALAVGAGVLCLFWAMTCDC
jgi:hypothetical protein